MKWSRIDAIRCDGLDSYATLPTWIYLKRGGGRGRGRNGERERNGHLPTGEATGPVFFFFTGERKRGKYEFSPA